MSFMLLGQE